MVKLWPIRRFFTPAPTSYRILNVVDDDDFDDKIESSFDLNNEHSRESTTTDVQIVNPNTTPDSDKHNESFTTSRKSSISDSCKTVGCIDLWIRQFFAIWGRIVARHPWPILLIPIILTIGLSVGFRYIKMETNQEKIYTPINGQAKIDRQIVEDLFASVATEEQTTPLRLTELGRYVQVIFTKDGGDGDDENVLTSNLLDKASDVNHMVLNHVTNVEGAFYKYQDLCIMWKDSCLPSSVLTLYEDDPEYFIKNNVTYPYSFLPDGNVGFLGAELGVVELWEEDEFEPEFSPVKSAKGFRLLYHLKSDGEMDEISAKFEAFVVKEVRKMSADGRGIYAVAFASRTPDDEVKAATWDTFLLFPLAAGLLLVFTVSSSMTKDPVRSKPWLAIAALLSTFLAMLSAPGLLALIGVPCVDTVGAMPYIIIGRGLDDAFIMLAAWRQSDTNLPVEARMSLTLADAIMSITATTVTDALAFLVGSISSFQSVRIFCFYTGLAVVFDYFYQITFFAACMVFTGRREAAGRHCFTWKPIQRQFFPDVVRQSEEEHDFMSKTVKINSSERFMDSASGKVDHAFMAFFRDKFGPFILHPCVKIVAVLVYLCYIGIAIWGCVLVQQGLVEQNLVREGSDANWFLDLKYEYFKTYEPAVSIVITSEERYWEEETQEVIRRTLSELEEDEQFHDSSLTISWLHEYQRFLQLVGISNMTQDLFMSILREQFLLIPAFEPFRQDLVFDGSNTSIISTRYFVMGKNLYSSEDEKAAMLKARHVAKNCEFDAVAYSPAFIYYDQFVAVIPTTVQNMAIAIASIVLVSFLLIPSTTCCVWVILSVVSILVGVIGYMTFWNVNLHSMSLLTLILGVGFSVDYTIHITMAYVSAEGRRRARVIHALYAVGMPIVQGTLSTILAVFICAFSSHYGVRVFFKSLTLVLLFGMAHGLVFLPVILSTFGPS